MARDSTALMLAHYNQTSSSTKHNPSSPSPGSNDEDPLLDPLEASLLPQLESPTRKPREEREVGIEKGKREEGKVKMEIKREENARRERKVLKEIRRLKRKSEKEAGRLSFGSMLKRENKGMDGVRPRAEDVEVGEEGEGEEERKRTRRLLLGGDEGATTELQDVDMDGAAGAVEAPQDERKEEYTKFQSERQLKRARKQLAQEASVDSQARAEEIDTNDFEQVENQPPMSAKKEKKRKAIDGVAGSNFQHTTKDFDMDDVVPNLQVRKEGKKKKHKKQKRASRDMWTGSEASTVGKGSDDIVKLTLTPEHKRDRKKLQQMKHFGSDSQDMDQDVDADDEIEYVSKGKKKKRKPIEGSLNYGVDGVKNKRRKVGSVIEPAQEKNDIAVPPQNEKPAVLSSPQPLPSEDENDGSDFDYTFKKPTRFVSPTPEPDIQLRDELAQTIEEATGEEREQAGFISPRAEIFGLGDELPLPSSGRSAAPSPPSRRVSRNTLEAPAQEPAQPSDTSMSHELFAKDRLLWGKPWGPASVDSSSNPSSSDSESQHSSPPARTLPGPPPTQSTTPILPPKHASVVAVKSPVISAKALKPKKDKKRKARDVDIDDEDADGMIPDSGKEKKNKKQRKSKTSVTNEESTNGEYVVLPPKNLNDKKDKKSRESQVEFTDNENTIMGGAGQVSKANESATKERKISGNNKSPATNAARRAKAHETLMTRAMATIRRTSVGTQALVNGDGDDSVTPSVDKKIKKAKKLKNTGGAESLSGAVDAARRAPVNIQALFNDEGSETTRDGSSGVVNEKSKENGTRYESFDNMAQEQRLNENNMITDEWELGVGKIRGIVGGEGDDMEIQENIAFSSSYLSTRPNGIKISNTTFRMEALRPEAGWTIRRVEDVNGKVKEDVLKTCFVQRGRVKVRIGKMGWSIGKGGVWRVRGSEECYVRNEEKGHAVVVVFGVEG